MEIEIVEFKKQPIGNKLGKVLVRYHDIFIRCELVYHATSKSIWIRMPEHWVTKEKKLRFCYWEHKENSDLFQKTVLNKLFDKYDLDQAKIEEIFLNSRAYKPAKKTESQK